MEIQSAGDRLHYRSPLRRTHLKDSACPVPDCASTDNAITVVMRGARFRARALALWPCMGLDRRLRLEEGNRGTPRAVESHMRLTAVRIVFVTVAGTWLGCGGQATSDTASQEKMGSPDAAGEEGPVLRSDATVDAAQAADATVDTAASPDHYADVDAGPETNTEGALESHLDVRSEPACDPAFTTAGCDAASVCLYGAQDACAFTFCGCDGLEFFGGCGFSDRPFLRVHNHDDWCPGATPDGGACPVGTTLLYTAPGCEAKPSCQTSATLNSNFFCLGKLNTRLCGCDGLTFTAVCGAGKKPYVHEGPCGDAGPTDW